MCKQNTIYVQTDGIKKRRAASFAFKNISKKKKGTMMPP